MTAATAIRKTVLTMLYKAEAGHLGCNMSVIEMLMAMYESVDVDKIKAGAPDRDRIIVSKGHCAAATYAVMNNYGIISDELIDGYHLDGSVLARCVSHGAPGVEHSCGALGHGINVAVGCALGMKRRGYAGLSLALVGDGELQEGSVWEALMFAVHHKLNNFVLLVDNNQISSITRTDKVIDLNPLKDRFQGFGLNTRRIRGHDLGSIKDAITDQDTETRPTVIICETLKGCGVSFAEDDPRWHYATMNKEQYDQAMEAL